MLLCYTFLQVLDLDLVSVLDTLLYCNFMEWGNVHSPPLTTQVLSTSMAGAVPRDTGTVASGMASSVSDRSPGSLLMLLSHISFLFLLNFDIEPFLFFSFLCVLNSGIVMHGIDYISFGRAERAKEENN